MALHAAYLDESYGNEDAYSAAGYVATIEQWKRFEGNWQEMLAEFQCELLAQVRVRTLEGASDDGKIAHARASRSEKTSQPKRPIQRR